MTPLSRWSLTLLLTTSVSGLGGLVLPAAAQSAPTCCLCQRTDNGSVAARGYFNINQPYTCTNALTDPTTLGTRQASEASAISCAVPGASCPNPQPSSQMLTTLLPVTAATAAAGTATAPASQGATPQPPIIPTLSVEIPGLQFGAITTEDQTTRVPFLAQYIAAVYRFAISIAALAATIVMVYAGFLYLMGSATGDIKKAKEMMINAVAGLLLMLGGYAILANINENVLQLGPLNLTTIDETTVLEDEVDFATPAQVAALPPAAAVNSSSASRPAQASFVRTTPNDCMSSMQVNPAYQPILLQASQLFCQRRPAGSDWRIIGGGARSVTTQLRMWVDRCWGKPQCDFAMTCNPVQAAAVPLAASLIDGPRPSLQARNSAYNLFLDHLDPLHCPHQSGLAVDINCNVSGGTNRPMIACQLLLEHAMHDAGACRLRQETWHFEPNQYRVSGNSCLFDESWIGRVQKPRDTAPADYSNCPNRWRYDTERCSDT